MFALMLGYFAQSHQQKGYVIILCALAVIAIRMPNDIDNMTRDYKGSNISYQLWKNSDDIRNFLSQAAPGDKLIDSADGMFAYLLDMPSESYAGYPSSREELERRRTIGRWRSLISRGFTLLPGGGYVKLRKLPSTVRVVEPITPPSSPVVFYRMRFRRS